MAMISNPRFTGDDAQRAMLDGLTARIRSGLRERILESIEPDLKAAIDAAVDGLKLAIDSYRDPSQLRDTVHVIIHRMDKPAGTS